MRVDIRRQSNDGKTNAFELTLEPAGLLKDAPSQPMIVEIDDATQQWSREFEKADDLPPTAQKLTVLLAPYKSEPDIAPRLAYVDVTPKPASEGSAGSSGEAQSNAASNEAAATDANSVEPDLNSAASSPDGTVANGASNALSNAVSNGVGGAAESNTATVVPKRKGNGPEWGEIAKRWYPMALVVPLAGLLWWLASRGAARNGSGGDEPVPEPQDERPGPAGEPSVQYCVRLGRGGFPGGEPRLDLPEIGRSFSLRMGEHRCPEPLPIVETADG